MDVLFLIGRILFAALFLSSAMGHFMQTDAMAGYAESRGVKPGRLAVLVSGAQIAIGGLLVVLGIWMDVGFILIALFLFGTSFLIHSFWNLTDPQDRYNDQVHFLKDLGLAGAALMGLAAVWLLGGDLDLTITDPLFNP